MRRLNGRDVSGAGTHARPLPTGIKKALPQIYLTNRKKIVSDVFLEDQGHFRHGAGFRWFLSTSLAGIAGLTIILSVIAVTSDFNRSSGSLFKQLPAQWSLATPVYQPRIKLVREDTGKTDRESAKGEALKQILQQIIVEERQGRDYVSQKTYAHLIGKFATSYNRSNLTIPLFNPYNLYANKKPVGSAQKTSSNASNASVRITRVKLDTDNLETIDFHGMDIARMENIVTAFGRQIIGIEKLRSTIRSNSPEPANEAEDIASLEYNRALRQVRNLTVLSKKREQELVKPRFQKRDVMIKSGDTLIGLLRRNGASSREAMHILKVMRPILPPKKVKPGQKIRFVMMPSTKNRSLLIPVKISVFKRQKHLVSIARKEGGKYIGSKNPLRTHFTGNRNRNYAQQGISSLYKAAYRSTLPLGLPRDRILQMLRVHAFDTDFKAKVRAGDMISALYELPDDAGTAPEKASLGTLLMTQIRNGSETRKFYRFRTPDGSIDFYDKMGRSARKFLLLKPVRNARLTSGFGYRFHPILRRRKMHKGIDWAGVPVGTPILAAGNGIVEKIKPTAKSGGYGNYVRLRHANGYKTSYAHLHKYAKGLRTGMKIRQGQIIGYLGNTGRSTAAHLHYEVLVNDRHINPMSLNVPRGRNLNGKLAAVFQEQRKRIDAILQLRPVRTQISLSNEDKTKRNNPALQRQKKTAANTARLGGNL